jgi:hypothetical protein
LINAPLARAGESPRNSFSCVALVLTVWAVDVVQPTAFVVIATSIMLIYLVLTKQQVNTGLLWLRITNRNLPISWVIFYFILPCLNGTYDLPILSVNQLFIMNMDVLDVDELIIFIHLGMFHVRLAAAIDCREYTQI